MAQDTPQQVAQEAARDREKLSDLINKAPPHVAQDAFAEAARQVPADEYRQHIMPGLGGTDPLGGLARSALPSIAGALLNGYLNSQRGAPSVPSAPAGRASTAGGGSLDELIRALPGLETTNPQQMSPDEVAILADYLRQHHPDAFGKAATEVGRQDPDLLQQLLGNKALMIGAATLAAKLLSDRARARRQAA